MLSIQLLVLVGALQVMSETLNADAFVDQDCSTKDQYPCRVELAASCPKTVDNDALIPTSPIDFRSSSRTIHHTKAAEHENDTQTEVYKAEIVFDWGAPHDETREILQGFEVNILDPKRGVSQCYKLNTNQINWTAVPSDANPRFKFRTVDGQLFDKQLTVEVQSLPKKIGEQNYITRRVNTPGQPEKTDNVICWACWTKHKKECCTGINLYIKNLTELDSMSSVGACRNGSVHPYANVWHTAFRSVDINAHANTITVEFVAAPPEYCFEQYEIKLVHQERSYTVDQDVMVKASDLYTEVFSNLTVSFGRVVFENVERGASYNVLVKPYMRSIEDNRCLCPPIKYNDDLYHHAVPCQCSQTTLPRHIEVFHVYEPTTTRKPLLVSGDPLPKKGYWAKITTLLFTLLVALACIIICALLGFKLARRWTKEDAMVRIRFLAKGNGNVADDDQEAFCKTEPSTMTGTMSTIAGGHDNAGMTIIYSNDCDQHLAAVVALADLIRKQCGCKVQIDVQSVSEIARNKHDWAYSSVYGAQKVIFVHSVGAFYRYQVKLAGNGVIKRRDSELNPNACFDDLFLMQLDHVNNLMCSAQRHKVLSIRFDYTPETYLLKHLAVDTRYSIPHNLPALCNAVRPQLPPPDTMAVAPLQQAIAQMERLIAESGGSQSWFEHTHKRVPIQLDVNQPNKDNQCDLSINEVDDAAAEDVDQMLPSCSKDGDQQSLSAVSYRTDSGVSTGAPDPTTATAQAHCSTDQRLEVEVNDDNEQLNLLPPANRTLLAENNDDCCGSSETNGKPQQSQQRSPSSWKHPQHDPLNGDSGVLMTNEQTPILA